MFRKSSAGRLKDFYLAGRTCWDLYPYQQDKFSECFNRELDQLIVDKEVSHSFQRPDLVYQGLNQMRKKIANDDLLKLSNQYEVEGQRLKSQYGYNYETEAYNLLSGLLLAMKLSKSEPENSSINLMFRVIANFASELSNLTRFKDTN